MSGHQYHLTCRVVEWLVYRCALVREAHRELCDVVSPGRIRVLSPSNGLRTVGREGCRERRDVVNFWLDLRRAVVAAGHCLSRPTTVAMSVARLRRF